MRPFSRKEQVTPDPYALLGVAVGASVEDVRKAYHRKVKELHPDISGKSDPQASLKMAQLQSAYQKLTQLAKNAGRPYTYPNLKPSTPKASSEFFAQDFREQAMEKAKLARDRDLQAYKLAQREAKNKRNPAAGYLKIDEGPYEHKLDFFA
jgi:curved DNA-binding protein CbpA